MKNVQNNIPELRFSEFSNNWNDLKYNDIFSFYTTNSFSRDKLNYLKGEVRNIHYGDIHTKFPVLFDLKKERVPFINKDVNISKIKEENYCKEGDLVIADASEDYNDIGKTIEIVNLNSEKVIAGLHTFLARPTKNKVALGFTGYLLQTWFVRKQVMTIAQGSKVLGLSYKRLGEINLSIPSTSEQQKIASFLTTVDTKITQLTHKKELLALYKKGLMQQIFNQEIRFKDEKGNKHPKWKVKMLGALLDYEQPTKYIVSSTDYDNSFETPVLTAGKSFVLGYTDEKENIFYNFPVIIFDDFTMANKFVDFPFKVKSSAMKILKPSNQKVNLIFVYESMQMINYPKGAEHKRFWISEYSKIKIPFPCLEEQNQIANFLSSIDDKINQVAIQLERTKTFKKGLLQQMFV